MFTQLNDLDQLEVKTDTGAEITIHFENSSVECINIDGYEYDATDDVLKSLFVKVDGQFYTLLGVSQKAGIDYEDICEETRQEMEEEDAMRRELSSPYLTGRI